MNMTECLTDLHFNGVSKFFVENFTPTNDEYISSDGSLVICRKCKLPRYIRKYMPLLKHEMYVRQDCDCDRAEYRKIEKRERDRWILEYYNTEPYLRAVGEKYRNAHFNELPETGCDSTYITAKNKLVSLESAIESNLETGQGWYLCSNESGNGKTCLAACFRNALLERGISCVLMTDIDIVDDISERKVIDRIFSYETYYNTDVLIIDDIGTDRSRFNGTVSAETNRYIYSVINSRYVDRKMTCFTSNYMIPELRAIGYERKIIDRITEMASPEIIIAGESFRGAGISRPY